jgi:hypothetical protein
VGGLTACAYPVPMRLLFALLFSGVVPLAKAGDQPLVPELSGYPQTEAFLHFVGMHTNAAQHAGHVLAVTEFTKVNGTSWEAWVYWLGESGIQYYTHEYFPECGAGSYRQPFAAPQAGRRKLISAIQELASTNALPAVENLLLVAVRQGTNWVTHSYDKRNQTKVLGLIRENWDFNSLPNVRNFTVQ